MIEELLPWQAAGVSWRGAILDQPLWPAELAAADGFSPQRRAEFAGVRWCARVALGRLGASPAAIVPDERGCPVWPPNIVGSMTHCDGFLAAAVAWSGPLVSLGLDAEPHRELSDGVDTMVHTDTEQRRRVALSRSHAGIHWDTVLFSIKETVYKTWFPLTRRWLDFGDVEVTIDPGRGRFVACVGVSDGPTHVLHPRVITGRWAVRSALVLTAAGVTGRHYSGPSGESVGRAWQQVD